MGMLRHVLAIGAGIAAAALAVKLLEDHNKDGHLEGEYVEIPMNEPDDIQDTRKTEENTSEPDYYKQAQRPDNGPNANPVVLGAAEKPLTEDGKLDPMRIASPEDFAEWDDMGCQG